MHLQSANKNDFELAWQGGSSRNPPSLAKFDAVQTAVAIGDDRVWDVLGAWLWQPLQRGDDMGERSEDVIAVFDIGMRIDISTCCHGFLSSRRRDITFVQMS